MESKHTPGPWRSDLVTCASGRSVRAIAAPSHRICDVRVYDARDAANVRLMVAAPELLAALKSARDSVIEALDYMDAHQRYDDHPLKPKLHSVRLVADAAIARATEGR